MTSREMPPESLRLTEALVAAYAAYVESRVDRWEPGSAMAAAVHEGSRWLRAELTEVLTLPFAQQQRGPLEVFQEAMRFPTRALAAAGAEPVSRDPISKQALPGDVYDLAPASTQVLGDEVWALHLSWGIAKATAITQERAAPPGDAG